MRAGGVGGSVTAPVGACWLARVWGGGGPNLPPRHLPVVCLPGLSRTAEDFDALASAIAADAATPRRVLALDSRGRGLSDYDRNPKNYPIPPDIANVLAVLGPLRPDPPIFVARAA